VAADQATKQWAVNRLDRSPCSVEGSCIDLFWTLRFRLSFNSGAAFSSFTGGGSVLGVIAIAMSVYLAVLASRSTDSWSPWVFGTIIGGAVGNLTDRVFRADDGLLSGAVVDFIDFQFWPIFNVADIAIVGGVIVLAGRLWWLDREANRLETRSEPVDATRSDDQHRDERP
jgi:signal peptidase II